jgi:hypothetical protein
MKLHKLPKKRISQINEQDGMDMIKDTRAKVLYKTKHKASISKKPKIMDEGLEELDKETLEAFVNKGNIEKLKKTRNRKGRKVK